MEQEWNETEDNKTEEIRILSELPHQYADVRDVEKSASDHVPSSDGAWWIMLQTAMSIINHAIVRDPVNNRVLKIFWQDVAKRNAKEGLIPLYDNGGVRPLPYDDLMQLIAYCGKQLEDVVKNPKHTIVKVDKMVVPYRLKRTGNKTMDWLGKQPGRTIKEKLSGKNKMLTQESEYSYDIKENQVAMMLYKLLNKRVKERIEHGILKDGYDEDASSAEIEKMQRIKKLLRNSDIAEASPTNHTVANNALLSDKNYSIIWRAYLEACKYERKIAEKWDLGMELFVRAVFLSFHAVLTRYTDVKTIENQIHPLEVKEHVIHVVGCDTVSPIIIESELDGNKMYVKIMQHMRDEEVKTEYVLSFGADVGVELEAKRGYPLWVAIYFGSEVYDKFIWADMAGACSIVDWLIFQIEEHYGQELTYGDKEVQQFHGTCVFDALSNGRFTTIDNEEIDAFYKEKAVIYGSGETAHAYRAGERSIYEDADDYVFISDAVSEQGDTRALTNALEDISNAVLLEQDDFFIYTIPDALEEFSQKKLKQCVNTWFTRTFPVWRSVAGITELLLYENEDFFQEGDVFISIDLMGESGTAGILSLKYEEKLSGYICNHYPPFPETDEGDFITEKAFAASYLDRYLKQKNWNLPDAIRTEVVESGILHRILHKQRAEDFIYIENGKITILPFGFNEKIAKECGKEWLEHFVLFWKPIAKRLQREKMQVNFVDMLSDVVMHYINIKKLKQCISSEKHFRNVYMSSSSSISEGAYAYLERLRNHLPTWNEYLPKLKLLKVAKVGRYEDIELIDDNVHFDVMDEDSKHEVKETMMLTAGREEYRFKLKKEDISRKAVSIDAYVKDKSFPLKKNVSVKLTVRYKYGFDNSYELILRPEKQKNAPFSEILVEWKEGVKEEKKSLYPIYPDFTNYEKTLRDIENVKNSMERAQNVIERFFVNYQTDNARRCNMKKLAEDLTRPTFVIRNIIVHEDIPEAKEFVNWFFNSQLFILCEELAGLIKNKKIPNAFFKEFRKEHSYENLVCSSMQLIYAFGKKTPVKLQNYLIEKYDTLQVIHKDNILLNMLYLNSDNNRIMDIVLREAVSHNKMDVCIKEISSLCWFDPKMIYKLKEYPAFLRAMLTYIKSELEARQEEAEHGKVLTDWKMKNQRKRYVRYVEMILAILRLREDAEFDLLVVDSRESNDLAETIRVVDDYFGNPESKIKFKVDKPPALRNMSDVAYAVDMYLTGDEGVDLIEVVSVDLD